MGAWIKRTLIFVLLTAFCGTVSSAWAIGDEELLQASNWTALQEAIDGAVNGAVITLTEDVTAGPSDRALLVPEGKMLILELGGHTLDRNLGGQSDVRDRVLQVSAGAVLTIRDSGAPAGSITGGHAANGGGIDNRGTLFLEGGCVTGNTATEDGGGIINYGILVLIGGSVTGNTAAVSGGGVYNAALGSMTSADGAVYGNTAPDRSDINNEGSLSIPGVREEKAVAIRSYVEALSFIPAIALLIALAFAVRIDAYLSREQKRTLYAVTALMFLLIIQNFLEYRLSMDGRSSALRIPLSIMGYAVRPAILALFLRIVKPSGRYGIAWAMTGVNAAVYLTAFFSPVAFRFHDNHFITGPLIGMCTAVSLLLLVWLLVLSIRQFHLEERRESWIPIFAAVLVAGSVYLDFTSVYNDQPVTFLTIAIVISCVFYYVWLHLQFVREHEQALLAEQRIRIMMTQIQPHFLFNTLSTIRALVAKDPPAAIRIIETFSVYLRENLESLDRTELIPLERELQHTRAYAEIEQQRFPNIHVQYDIQDKDCRLPALTIQPLVENAIRHGVRGLDNGIVTVRVRREGDAHLITISDNGAGFDPGEPAEGNGHHIGLENVRERLARMSGGTLTVDSRPGGGTVVMLRIPGSVQKGGKP